MKKNFNKIIILFISLFIFKLINIYFYSIYLPSNFSISSNSSSYKVKYLVQPILFENLMRSTNNLNNINTDNILIEMLDSRKNIIEQLNIEDRLDFYSIILFNIEIETIDLHSIFFCNFFLKDAFNYYNNINIFINNNKFNSLSKSEKYFLYSLKDQAFKIDSDYKNNKYCY